MDVLVKPGKYVVAVSGGVDSMALLDVLAGRPELQLIVAHFEHGIREDSDLDRQQVQKAAEHYGLPFVWERGHLGSRVSEARAREARYNFLHRVKKEQGAAAVITAHHEDDLIETATLNMLRGTHRKGLSSLTSTTDVLRPLLHIPKREIYDYVRQHPAVTWRDDSTNNNEKYLRNYVRHHMLAALSEADRQRLLKHIRKANATNPVIDALLAYDLDRHSTAEGLERPWFVMLPYDVSCEVMAAWLRAHGVREFDRRAIARLVVAAKVDKPGKVRDINAAYLLNIGKTSLQLIPRNVSRETERVCIIATYG